jgi:hypothetical protein
MMWDDFLRDFDLKNEYIVVKDGTWYPTSCCRTVLSSVALKDKVPLFFFPYFLFSHGGGESENNLYVPVPVFGFETDFIIST